MRDGATRGKGKAHATRGECTRNCCMRSKGEWTFPTLPEMRRSGDIQIILYTPVEGSRNYDFAIKEEAPANSSRVFQLFSQKEQRLKVFENKVLRKIFGTEKDEVTGERRKLHSAELHSLYSSPDIIRNVKSRRLRWAGHVALFDMVTERIPEAWSRYAERLSVEGCSVQRNKEKVLVPVQVEMTVVIVVQTKVVIVAQTKVMIVVKTKVMIVVEMTVVIVVQTKVVIVAQTKVVIVVKTKVVIVVEMTVVVVVQTKVVIVVKTKVVIVVEMTVVIVVQTKVVIVAQTKVVIVVEMTVVVVVQTKVVIVVEMKVVFMVQDRVVIVVEMTDVVAVQTTGEDGKVTLKGWKAVDDLNKCSITGQLLNAQWDFPSSLNLLQELERITRFNACQGDDVMVMMMMMMMMMMMKI
ncbi:hypothetical protein ANN_18201 [Periplaneta americana]|uniref:Uncharacterized protein n=1 Tax=Periplaneta americana TaxID=6978 RepID=A0ABQ8SQ71_PERAM|nr:hypothetical protein ANN_18201 [Periplaneta americana]